MLRPHCLFYCPPTLYDVPVMLCVEATGLEVASTHFRMLHGVRKTCCLAPNMIFILRAEKCFMNLLCRLKRLVTILRQLLFHFSIFFYCLRYLKTIRHEKNLPVFSFAECILPPKMHMTSFLSPR